MTQGEFRRPVSDAYSIHAKYWADSAGDVRVPVDPFEIASDMGVRVATAILGPNESGFLSVDDDGEIVIVLNDSHSFTRQRFTCAHELGHLVDHRNRGIPIGTSWRAEKAAEGTDADEIYSNRFAAAMLMPASEVERLHKQGLDCPQLARRFRVSEQAMEWRLTNLGFR